MPVANLSRWAPLAVVLLAVLVHAGTLRHQFTLDDRELILEEPRIGDFGRIVEQFRDGRIWRPVQRLSLTVDHAIWGTERPGGFHLTNVLLHGAATAALLLALGALGAERRLSLIAAALFAVHPIHVEVVANVSHRKESLALLFQLLALACAANALARQPRLSPLGRRVEALGRRFVDRPGWGRLEAAGLATLLYLLAMGSKEVAAVMLPAVLLAHHLLLGAGTTGQRCKRVAWVSLASLPVLLLFWWKGHLSGLPARFSEEMVFRVTSGQASEYSVNFFTAVQSFAVNLRLLIWPWPLVVGRGVPLATGPFELGVLAGAGLFLASGVMLIGLARRWPWASFAVAWLLLQLLPVSNLVPLTYWWNADRFLYVPSVGFALLLAVLLDAGWSRRWAAVPADWQPRLALGSLLLLVSLGALVSAWQSEKWRNSLTLWAHVLEHQPDSWFAHRAMGGVADRSGDLARAELHYREAYRLAPRRPETRLSLATLLSSTGRHAEAIPLLGRPGEGLMGARSHRLLARLATERGDVEEALEHLEAAVATKPGFAAAWHDLGVLYLRSGEVEEARSVLRRARRVAGGAELAILEGHVAQQSGRPDQALAAFRQATALDEHSPATHSALGLHLIRLGRTQDGTRSLRRSLELLPRQPDIRALVERIESSGAK